MRLEEEEEQTFLLRAPFVMMNIRYFATTKSLLLNFLSCRGRTEWWEGGLERKEEDEMAVERESG